MRSKLFVQNLRCNGCASTIRKALLEIDGITEIQVLPCEDKVTFSAINEYTNVAATLKLKNLGYPTFDSSNSFNDRVKSFISCAKGKLS